MSNDSTNFPYDASRVAAILFTVLFGLTLLVHFGQAIRGRCRYLIPLLIATALETAGYVFRYLAIKMPTQEWPSIISQIFIIIAPAFLAANEYMIFGRIMAYVGSEHGLIRPTIITKLFVGADILTIFTQAAGGSMMACHLLVLTSRRANRPFDLQNGDNMSSLRTGRLILIGGLAAQVGTFAIFMVLAVAFDIRTRRRLGSDMKAVHPLMWALYASGVLIIIRSVYRTIEFSQIRFTADDESGYVVDHEWLFYVLDSLLVFAATVVLNIIHPSGYIPSRKGLRMDGTTYEVESSSWCCCCCGRRKRKSRNTSESETQLKPIQQSV